MGKFVVAPLEVRAELFDAAFQAEPGAACYPGSPAPLQAVLLARVTPLRAHDQVGLRKRW